MVPQPVEVDPVHHLAQPQVDDPQDHLHHLLLSFPRHVLLRPARLHHQEDDWGLNHLIRRQFFLKKMFLLIQRKLHSYHLRNSAYLHTIYHVSLSNIQSTTEIYILIDANSSVKNELPPLLKLWFIVSFQLELR